jgi:predicted XRE-type DNA-binding protein
MTKIIESSGNIFEDLGFEDAEERSLKSLLAIRINSIITHRHLTQAAAGKLLGIPQPKVSNLLNGKLENFSVERLIYFLLRLDRNVDIRIRKKPATAKTARIRVEAENMEAFVAA